MNLKGDSVKMSARKIVVEEAPQFTPEQMAAAAASLPAVVVNEPAPEERIEQIENGTPAAALPEEPAQEQPEAPAMPDAETAFDLRRAVEHKGMTYARVELDRDRLTGEAVTRAERIYMVECPNAGVQNMLNSLTFMQILGSIAAGIPYAVVKKMDGVDAFRLATDATALFFGR